MGTRQHSISNPLLLPALQMKSQEQIGGKNKNRATKVTIEVNDDAGDSF